MGIFDTDALARMRFGQLDELRSLYPDQETQNLLAPYEHRAYAREIVAENPLMALGLLGAIPGYQIKKLVKKGLLNQPYSRSEPSMEQVKQGYMGLWEGLTK